MATFIGHPTELVNYGAGTRSGRAAPRTESQLQSSGAETKARVSSASQDDGLYHLCLLDSGKKRNPWATFASLSFELLLVAAIVVIPLFHTELLPKRERVTMLYLPSDAAVTSNSTKVRAPEIKPVHAAKDISVPTPAPKTQEAPAPQANPTVAIVTGIPGGVSDGIPGGVLSDVLGSTPSLPVLAKAPTPAPKRIRVAQRVVEANLIHEVAPTYPPEAGRKRIEGTVVLLAVIGKDGSVQDVQLQSGLSILAQAAIAAVKQWRYKPYMLNGEPVEVDSKITVNFALSAG